MGRRLTSVVLGIGAIAAVAAGLTGSLAWPYVALATVAGAIASLVVHRRAGAVSGPRLARALFVAAIATWALVVSRCFAATPSGVLQSGALVFAGFALLGAAGFLHAPGRWPSAARALDFVLFQAALLVVGLDVGLRWMAEWHPSQLWLPALASPSAQLAAFHEQPGAVRFWFPCNSLGYYDDEPPAADDPRRWIACVGDSFVASYVPHPLHFSTVAEDLTGATIQCFGVNAAGPREYLQLLEREVLPRRPDSLLLVLFVGNDVTDSWRIETSWFQRCFHPDNAPLFSLWRRLELLHRAQQTASPSRHGRVEGDTIYIDTPDGTHHATRRELVALLPKIAPGLWDPARQRPVLEESEFLELNREASRLICSPASASWEPFFTAMERLLDAARGHELSVLLIPCEFQVDDALWSRVAAGDPALDRDLPQRRIGEYLRAREIPMLDVLPALRAAAARGERTYLIRDGHLDRVGNEVVGRELAEFLGPSR